VKGLGQHRRSGCIPVGWLGGDHFGACGFTGDETLQRVVLADGEDQHGVENRGDVEAIAAGAEAEEAGVEGRATSRTMITWAPTSSKRTLPVVMPISREVRPKTEIGRSSCGPRRRQIRLGDTSRV
jgi:hypothetical protein